MSKPKTKRLPRRASTVVPRKGLEAIARRERLDKLLHWHDRETPRRAAALGDADWAILRQIAQEGAMTNVGPIREAAIYRLAAAPSAENLNLLAALAQHGEDFYVRGHALVALGRTGLSLAGPILVAGLDAEERDERLAAEHGLALLGRRLGAGALGHLLADKRWQGARARIARRISRLAAVPQSGRRRAKATTTAPGNGA